MQINTLFRLKSTKKAIKNEVITDRQTDRPTDRQSELLSRLHATKKRMQAIKVSLYLKQGQTVQTRGPCQVCLSTQTSQLHSYHDRRDNK